jgi:predicted metal-dependent peptidase
MKKQKQVSKKKLLKICQKWQMILGLRDWQIGIRYAKDDKEIPGAGQCNMTATHRQATILILKPKYILKREYMDLEDTIVHELIHIPINQFFDGKDANHATYLAWEQTVSALAEAFMEVKHGNRRK